MTNEQKCRWLQTKSAFESIVQTHVDGTPGIFQKNRLFGLRIEFVNDIENLIHPGI